MNIVKSQNHITLYQYDLKVFEIWREKNPTVRSILGSNKLATMRRAIIKNKYISEMEIDEIKLEEQSKCENQLQNVEANNNRAHSDQHPMMQPNGDIESQHTSPLQTHADPEQISNNVKSCLNFEEINIDLQSQPELDE